MAGLYRIKSEEVGRCLKKSDVVGRSLSVKFGRSSQKLDVRKKVGYSRKKSDVVGKFRKNAEELVDERLRRNKLGHVGSSSTFRNYIEVAID
jgi:hypothetical protein